MLAPLLLVIGLIIVVYGSINFYIGLKGWQAVFRYVPFLSAKIYWFFFWLAALAYILAQLSSGYLPAGIIHWFYLIGAYWLAAMLYFFLIILGIGTFRWLGRQLHLLPKSGITSNPTIGLGVLVLVIALITYGAWNARHPLVHHYAIKLSKHPGSLNSVQIVMVSDIHFGNIIQDQQLTEMVNSVNKLQPDVVFLAGDMMDENIGSTAKQELAALLQHLQAKYGVYACLGNHEYIGGQTDETIKYLDQAGINVLRDQAAEIAHSFNLIGRDDLSGSRYWGHKRKDLSVLKKGLNPQLPLIVLDHQPSHLEEPEEQGVDLQFSGHTHAGQIWPISLITKLIFEDYWGLMQKGNFHIIVSSGYGTWGPPVRIGNTPEIVDVTLN